MAKQKTTIQIVLGRIQFFWGLLYTIVRSYLSPEFWQKDYLDL